MMLTMLGVGFAGRSMTLGAGVRDCRNMGLLMLMMRGVGVEIAAKRGWLMLMILRGWHRDCREVGLMLLMKVGVAVAPVRKCLASRLLECKAAAPS